MLSDEWPPALSREAQVDAMGFGLSAGDMRRWSPFSPLEVYWGLKHDLSVETARSWAREGVSIRDAVRASVLVLDLDDIRPWTSVGFLASDAVDAFEAGISLETAIAWREVGFILPDALMLIEDGWTLEAARSARYADVGT